MRVAVVGATGAVGSTMLGVHARALVPGRRGRAVRLRALGGTHASTTATPSSPSRPLERRVDPGLRPRALLGRLGVSAEWAPRFADAGRGRRRQLVPVAHARRRAARGLRGEPGGARRPQRDRGQPELHDDADGRGAQADPRRGRDRAGGDVELPGGVGHRPEGGRGAARPGARRRSRPRRSRRRPSIRTRSPSTCCRRSRPSRTATTTRPRSASACARRARSSGATTSASPPPACACPCSPGTPCR